MSRWIVSCDLGQTTDPTAISVMEIALRSDAIAQQYTDPPGELASLVRNDWFRGMGPRNGELIERALRLDVRHLERLPLRMSYPEQMARVGALLRRPPLDAARPVLLFDETGVGRAVTDIGRHAGLKPIGVTITASGDKATQDWPLGYEEWHVGKLVLVSGLQAALHTGLLRIAKGLPDAPVLAEELQDFRAVIAEGSGYTTYGARSGSHDDLVLAVALGVWWATRPSSEATVHAVVT